MSGDAASLALAKQEFKEIQDNVSGYEKRAGLPTSPAEYYECTLLDTPGEEISGMSLEQLEETASDLSSYSIHIQRMLSKERGLLHWLESKINLAIANELNSYTGYYSHEQRRAVAITNNAYAKRLEELKMNCQLKVDILDGLTYQINQKCRVILETHARKRQQQRQ